MEGAARAMTSARAEAEAEAGAARLFGIGPRRLVGRAEELAQLAQIFASGERLVTLVGPPGVGKTRIALEAAAAAAQDRGLDPMGIALGSALSVDDVTAAVAGLLGVSAATTDPPARVAAALAGRPGLLLVLDDAEALVPDLGPLVSGWIAKAPSLRVLITSRTRLGLDEERVVEIAPLGLDDAVRLFEQRMRTARRGLPAPATSPDVLRALVERLDGLPLAIELTAARTSILPPPKLLARLTERATELLHAAAAPRPSGTRAVTPGRIADTTARHASLSAAIEVSWQLLGEDERDVLARIAAFAASFPLEAAEAVSPESAAVVDVLASLHERSLIQRIEPGAPAGELRFRLYASVRAFALDRLEAAGLRAETEARIDAFVADEGERLARDLEGAHARDAEERLELDRDQLVATHRRAAERAPAISARVGLALAELSALRGVGSTALHEATLRSARAAGDPKLVARALVAFGVAAARLGFVDEPRRALDDAIALAEREADGETLAGALLARGRYRAQHGAFDDADLDLSRAANVVDPLERPHVAASVKNVQGCVAEIRGDYAEAVRAFEAARAGFRRAGGERMEAAVLGNLGVVREAEGRREDSRRLYEAALERAVASGNRIIEADTRMNLGSWHLGEGDAERAEEHSRAALALQRRLGNRRFEGVSLANLAMAAHERGDLRAARDRYQEAVDTLRACGEARFEAMVLPFAAAAEAQLGLLLEARADFEAARRGPTGMDPTWPLVVDTLAAFLVLAEARRADPAAREDAERRARDRLARARDHLARDRDAPRRNELGLAVRLLSRALGEIVGAQTIGVLGEIVGAQTIAAPPPSAPERAPPPSAPASEPGSPLVVGDTQRWFSLGGERVDLSRRGPLRLILRALVEQRQDAPGVGLDAEHLFAVGWPGERALPHAAANRVYAAIATLRRLGLDTVLQRHDDGYLLNPAVSIDRQRG
ncbi:Signal transduction response regulator [Minicystis rosea]|nr:Signal transduction response regulator [Minicystis rosea]